MSALPENAAPVADASPAGARTPDDTVACGAVPAPRGLAGLAPSSASGWAARPAASPTAALGRIVAATAAAVPVPEARPAGAFVNAPVWTVVPSAAPPPV